MCLRASKCSFAHGEAEIGTRTGDDEPPGAGGGAAAGYQPGPGEFGSFAGGYGGGAAAQCDPDKWLCKGCKVQNERWRETCTCCGEYVESVSSLISCLSSLVSSRLASPPLASSRRSSRLASSFVLPRLVSSRLVSQTQPSS